MDKKLKNPEFWEFVLLTLTKVNHIWLHWNLVKVIFASVKKKSNQDKTGSLFELEVICAVIFILMHQEELLICYSPHKVTFCQLKYLKCSFNVTNTKRAKNKILSVSFVIQCPCAYLSAIQLMFLNYLDFQHLDNIRAENTKLKEENRALTRVISKLSK